VSAPSSHPVFTATAAGGKGTPLRLLPGGSPYPKASLLLRFGARVVDVAVAWGLAVVCGAAAGPLVALLFLLLADGMLQGQSVGKRVFGVKVMHLPTRSAARHRDSTLRNAPLALVVLLGMMPAPLGMVAFAAGLVVIGSVESWRVLRDPLGLRLGDVWAQTQVVDGKVVEGTRVAARGPVARAQASGRVMSEVPERHLHLERRFPQ
jgi:hypothetical protein